MSDTFETEHLRNKIENPFKVFDSDSVLSETDVTLLRTTHDTTMAESVATNNPDAFRTTVVESEPMYFHAEPFSGPSDIDEWSFSSLDRSSDVESESSELSQSLFEAELIKFLESFGVDENKQINTNTESRSEASKKEEAVESDPESSKQVEENDTEEFLKSMQMMEQQPNETNQERENASWFGSFGGMLQGAVKDSIQGWQSFGHGVKTMFSGDEKHMQPETGNLIDLSTEDEKTQYDVNVSDKHLTVNLSLETESADKNVVMPSEQEFSKIDKKDKPVGYFADVKEFGTAMKGFFSRNIRGLQPLGEAVLVEDITKQSSGECKDFSGESELIQNIKENQYQDDPPKHENLVDAALQDFFDPLTSIRYLFHESDLVKFHDDDADKRFTPCEQEVSDVLNYVNLASTSANEVLEAYQLWLPIRRITVKKLNQIANEMDESGKDSKFLDSIGIGSGLAGSAVALTGLMLAPVTGGIATGLIIKGGLMAGVGGITSAGAAIGSNVSIKQKLKEVETCIASDKENTEGLFEKLRNHASVINQAQESIENLRRGIILLLAQGVKFGAKTKKLLCIGMAVIKQHKAAVAPILKSLGLPGIKSVNKKLAVLNFAKAGAPTMIGVRAVKAMRIGHSLVPYLFMATAVWESIELYSTVSSLVRGDTLPEVAEVNQLIKNLETEITEITNELNELGILIEEGTNNTHALLKNDSSENVSELNHVSTCVEN